MNSKRIALIGNPNCGKTTLFNQLTGSRQRVGNWPGVTVDRKTGIMQCGISTVKVIDLPGIYSLTAGNKEQAIDEQIACQYIIDGNADIYINIIDASNLQRNLYLTLQLLEMNVPVIVALNMQDIARKRDINIDLDVLSKQLQCPVISLVSTRGTGINELKKTICDFNYKPAPAIKYSIEIENIIEAIDTHLNNDDINRRWLAIRLLEGDALALPLIDESTKNYVKQQQKQIEQSQQEDIDIIIADERYKKIAEIFNQCTTQKSFKKTITASIDNVVMHRIWGIPLFLFIMYLMFELSMNIGTLLQPLFDISSTVIFIDGVRHLGHLIGMPVWLIAIFSQGIGLGINTVVNFIPQIGLMFLFLSFLEDCGYMSRAAFVMDRFMQAVGLPGKAFIPLIVGFGCNVPSIMATRTLDNRRDRILTAMMSPFMSCGARLAIFVVFASAFFPNHGGIAVFSLYIIGILVAMLTGWILKISILRGEDTPFLMELPTYHWPYTKTLLLMSWQRLQRFIFRAGKIIVPVCVLVGSLNAIDIHGKIQLNGNRNSILANAGRAMTPLLAPIGVQHDNWPAAVGLITGTLAKEVVVGTLNSLYTQHESQVRDPEYNLWEGLSLAFSTTIDGLKNVFSKKMMNPFTANEADNNMTRTSMGNMVTSFGSGLSAFAYLLFVLLYIPCISTIGVIAREIGKGWAYLSTFWSFSIAYTVAVLFFQLATIALHPITSLSWIIGLILFQGLSLLLLHSRAGSTYANA